MKIITGAVVFIISLIAFVACIYSFSFVDTNQNDLLLGIGFFLVSICGIIYPLKTKFWINEESLRKANKENKLLELKLKKKELEERLRG